MCNVFHSLKQEREKTITQHFLNSTDRERERRDDNMCVKWSEATTHTSVPSFHFFLFSHYFINMNNNMNISQSNSELLTLQGWIFITCPLHYWWSFLCNFSSVKALEWVCELFAFLGFLLFSFHLIPLVIEICSLLGFILLWMRSII